MKVIILAGGFGTRLGPVAETIPKPMIRIGNRPIIWHIMKIYSAFGYNDFIICLGYKGYIIKDYFCKYKNHVCDINVTVNTGEIKYLEEEEENWSVTLAETGLKTLKGGRIKKIEKYLDSDINMLTYGDGLADISLPKLIDFHHKHNKIITITGVRPPSMFGEMIEKNGQVQSFEEKPQTSKGLISGGFMVFDKRLFNYLVDDENCDFEFGPLEHLAKEGQVMTYKHKGMWESADTVRDIDHLNKLWNAGHPFWKLWE